MMPCARESRWSILAKDYSIQRRGAWQKDQFELKVDTLMASCIGSWANYCRSSYFIYDYHGSTTLTTMNYQMWTIDVEFYILENITRNEIACHNSSLNCRCLRIKDSDEWNILWRAHRWWQSRQYRVISISNCCYLIWMIVDLIY